MPGLIDCETAVTDMRLKASVRGLLSTKLRGKAKFSPLWCLQLKQYRAPSQGPVGEKTTWNQSAENHMFLGPAPVQWVIWTG